MKEYNDVPPVRCKKFSEIRIVVARQQSAS